MPKSKQSQNVIVSDEPIVTEESIVNAGQEILHRPPGELKPYPGNARVHSEKQLAILMASIREYDFIGTVVTNEEGMILAGHGRVEAAKRLKLETVPTRVRAGLTKSQQRALVLMDNKSAQESEWNNDQLKIEIKALEIDDYNVELTGFNTAEIDTIMDDTPAAKASDSDELQPEDELETFVAQAGDIWRLGKHRLYCGTALQMESYAILMDGKEAQLVVTDPPYNVPIKGHVCGSGKIKHDEFAMAAGEMDSGQFKDFLETAYTLVEQFMQDGAVIYSFMDWRHQREILNAAEPVFGSPLQCCIWVKDNGGMGTFYRSQHEFVYVFKKGAAKHINNFELGQHGRYRTNVWNYPGVNTFKGKGHELLKLHPTVKPVGMIADAIRDCSHRGGIVLDPFAGSGTILIAAERTGRYARAIEYEPKYVDVAINRWERVTGELAVHMQSGATYSEMKHIKATEKEKTNG